MRKLSASCARCWPATRFPHAVILAGPPGALEKYTLALMVARNHELPAAAVDRWSGRIFFLRRLLPTAPALGQAEDPGRPAFSEAVEAREGPCARPTSGKTRILVQTHPDVLVVPPDPPQMMIKVDQVRQVIQTAAFTNRRSRGGRVFCLCGFALYERGGQTLC